jgi:glucokinase
MMTAPLNPLALGLDIGGSRTKLGLVDSSGRVVTSRDFSTRVEKDAPEAFIEQLLQAIHHLLDPHQGEVIGIGASFLGWLNEAGTGPQFCMNAPALHHIDFKTLLGNAFQLPVTVHDDVTAHTLAEYHFGSGRGSRRFLCLAMGTGLGAGVIINGQPLQFTGGCAGDTGHVILRLDGPACSSGCRGCAEALIGVAGIERLAAEKYATPRPASDIIRAAAEQRDPVAVQVMREIGGYTGELLSSLFPIFLPEQITLTGGTSRAGHILLEAAMTGFEELSGAYYRTYASLPGVDFRGVQISLSSLEGETGVIGAVVDFFRAAQPVRSS